jgi:secreted protein with Ig-like and vWFA domain
MAYIAAMLGDTPIRVTSLNPVRDAEGLGHVVGPSRVVIAAKNAELRRRFVRLLADGEWAASAATERAGRVRELLAQVAWAQRGISDDVTTLETAKEAADRRDELLRETLEEIAVIAELSTGQAVAPPAWRQALDMLSVHIEFLVDRDVHDAVVLADIDLALERIEHIEKTAAEALHSYLRYISV